MELLQKNERFYFKNDEAFPTLHDHIHFYLMSDYSIGMHRQEFFEINIVTRGKGVHYIGNNALNAEVGDVFIIPPEVDHGYTGGDGFDVYHIIISNKYIQKYFAELRSVEGFSMLFNVEPIMRASSGKPLHLKLTNEQFKRIAELLRERKDKHFSLKVEEMFINTGAFLIIVTNLCRFYIENGASANAETECQDTNFMQALELIHEKYNEKLTIERLAKEARMSRATFMRRFVRICKLSPAEYITRKRMEISESMLRTSNVPVSEIAESVGFYDIAHFSKVFSKYHGCSPLEYRKQQ